ncbi:S8 family peptidase [Pseudarthrobacter sp. NCCP-2145]|uniref:S8 family peptidase n=1 Tax=Pseudarthrobacter sp. NCCP-2145 TaxID=2942290 RepID=UPI00203FAFD5|nr:S8 family peptidase [Pseudarthrobacter sp. NCCP-2145]GKV72850.1 extracellular protease [Pseudarthrobacter sp. NCCP-2145]
MTHRSSPRTAVAIAVAAVLANTALALPAQADGELDSIRPTPTRAAPAASPATDQFIVGIQGGPGIGSEAAATSEAARMAAGRMGVAAQNVKGMSAGAQVVKTSRPLPGAEAEAFLAALRSSPGVAYAEPDIIMYPTAEAPNDPGYAVQWNLWDEAAGIRLPGAWDVNRGEGTVVAVVDTGITSHSELNSRVLPGYDMIVDAPNARDGDGRDANPQDEGDWFAGELCGVGGESGMSSWHGTHVAGTIAAVANNNDGVAGVAPEARLLPVRALGACGGYESDVADSIIWAAGGQVPGLPVNPNPARVINLSVGGDGPCSPMLQNAINLAHEAGAAVVVAAGNSNRPASGMSPANCKKVITVAASGRTGARASYSNYGDDVDVTAPGGDITSQFTEGILSTSNFGATTPGPEAYAFMQGTSMAAPHVSGIAALLMSEVGSSYTPEMVEKRLEATARPLAGGCPEGCGHGLVDAAEALDLSTEDLPAGVVLPKAVTFTDKDGTRKDTFTVPASKGVEYVRDGAVVKAGEYPGSGTVTVSARALPKYSLAAGATTQWAHTFSPDSAPAG